MAKARPISLRFPFGGLDKRLAYRRQPPFTTSDCLNVRPYGAIEGRLRGGSRPGLTPAYGSILGGQTTGGTADSVTTENAELSRITCSAAPPFVQAMVGKPLTFTVSTDVYYIAQVIDDYTCLIYDSEAAALSEQGNAFTIGSGSPIRMVSSVRGIFASVPVVWEDPFSVSPISDVWEAASETYTLEVRTEYGYVLMPGSLTPASKSGGLIRETLTFDNTQPYAITVRIPEWRHYLQGEVDLCARMNASNPDPYIQGVRATLRLSVIADQDITAHAHLKIWAEAPGLDDETSASWGGTVVISDGARLTLRIDGKTTKAYLNDTLACSLVLSDGDPQDMDGALTGTRMGFILDTMDIAPCRGIAVDYLRINYYPELGEDVGRARLVTSASGETYRENFETGALESIASSRKLASDRSLQAVERGGKLFIADNSNIKKQATDGTIDATGKILSSATIGAGMLTPPAVVVLDDVVVITDGGTGATPGVYTISACSATQITLTNACASGEETGISFRVECAPKVYDPVANTLSIWEATSGIIPVGCRAIARFRDRLFLGMDKTAPAMWYATAIGDPYDFNYGLDPQNPGKAIAGSSTDAGVIGTPLTALIPVANDYLIFGCRTELWVLRGDPGYAGYIENLSRVIGVVGPFAYAHLPDSSVAFLSHNGLYVLLPGATNYPLPVSNRRIPQELRNVDPLMYTAQLIYDPNYNVLQVFLTPHEKGDRYHYWVELGERRGTAEDQYIEGSFWPMYYQCAHEPFAVFPYAADTLADRRGLIGGRDGVVRTFANVAQDGPTAFDSHVTLGPFKLGDDRHDGVLTELIAVLSQESDDLTWSIMVADTHEEVISASALHTGTWSAGRNYPVFPRSRGGSCLIKIESANNLPWALENIAGRVELGSRQVVV